MISVKNLNFCIFNKKADKTQWYMGCSENQKIDFEQIKKQFLPLIAGVGGGRFPLYSGVAKKPENLEFFCSEFKKFLSS